MTVSTISSGSSSFRLYDNSLEEIASSVAALALDDDYADDDFSHEAASAAVAPGRTASEQPQTYSHKRGVWRVRSLADQKIVSASYDGTAKLWTPQRGQAPQLLSGVSQSGKRNEILSLGQLSDGTIVTGSANGYMQFWSAATGASKGYVQEKPKHQACGFYSIAVLANDIVATGACQQPTGHQGPWKHVIKLWDLHDRAELKSVKPFALLGGHQGGISGIASLDGTCFATSSADKTLKIWDITTTSSVQTLSGHTDYVYSVAAIGSNCLVSGSRDRTVRIWDVRTERESGRLSMPESQEAHTSTVYDVALFGDADVLTASRDAYVKSWDLRAGRCMRNLSTEDEYAYSVTGVGNDTIVAGTLAKGHKKEQVGNILVWKLD